MTKRKIGVLVSGRGSNFQAVADKIKKENLPIEITVVISDSPEAYALERAEKMGIPHYAIARQDYVDKPSFEAAIDKTLREAGVELVVLAGFMRILSGDFVNSWYHRIINIHPALLPSFTGLDAQGQALNYGVKIAGCTVHFVDAGMDTGPIIMQAAVPVLDEDTHDTLAARILVQEHTILPEVVKLWAEDRLTVNGRKVKIRRALLSVSDKTGIVKLGYFLNNNGVEIISTGGTMKVLKEAGVPVTYVSDVTGTPEMMDGRVKTLNPKIHGGILAVRSNPKHMEDMKKNGIQPIDLVVVNLYPFQQTIAKPDVTEAEAIENIDIGGPAMVRASAKNFHDVVIITNPDRYEDLIHMLKEKGDIDLKTRKMLAQEAFAHTAEYDTAIAAYLKKQLESEE